MPDATPAEGTSASADAPATPSPEIVALEARLKADFDKRAKGFQRAIAEKEAKAAELASQLEALQSAALSPDERAEAARQKLAEENAQLRAQIELAELESEYGDVMSTYRQLLSAGTAKDQLELLKTFSHPKPVEEPKPAEAEVPDVDMNNPPRPTDLAAGMTDSLAERILRSVGRQGDVTQRGARGSSQSGSEAS